MALPKGVAPGARGELAYESEGRLERAGPACDEPRESSAPEKIERVGTESWSCGVRAALALGGPVFGEPALGVSAFGELVWRRASSPRLLALSDPG